MLLSVDHGERSALVDASNSLTRYTWRTDRNGYVYRKVHGVRLYLHHIVMGSKPPSGMLTDHINRNKLDNRNSNLRFVTAAESNANRNSFAKNPTGFRGVDFFQGKWRARVQRGGKALVSRLFDDPADANAFLIGQRRTLMPVSFEGEGYQKA